MSWPDIRATYDAVASDYAEAFADELAGKPFDRSLLDSFARSVPAGPVLDIGCGAAGHITRHLADRGVRAVGLDVSSGVCGAAQGRQPDLPFLVADMRALPLVDACAAGVVAFYSLIHLPRPELPAALRECRRVLAPDGAMLLSFHGGRGELTAENWFDRDVTVRVTLVEPAELADLVRSAGFEVVEQLDRPPYPAEHQSRRLYLTARPVSA